MMKSPIMPEGEGEIYHIVGIGWWMAWKSYVDFDNT